jgi:predicted ArsR family transcriptional regulator
MRDGYVSVAQIRGGTGRPRYAFSLTEAGEDLFSHHYVRLTKRLVDEIVGLAPEDTTGRTGTELAGLLFEKMATRLADEYAPRVQGTTLEARLRSVVSLLANDGFDYEVDAAGDTLRLLGRGCPCARFEGIGAAAGACAHDRNLLETLVAAPVTPIDPLTLPNDCTCGYRIG